ncbi:MAG: APC family permease [Candidatus Aenigmatarchaeota archaeon]
MKRARIAKSIGFIESVSIALSLIIGSSIFVFPLIAARDAGPLSIIGWILGAVYAFIAALLLSELAIKYPKEGGPYAYLNKAFGLRVGFVSGWVFWLSYVFSLSVEIMILKLFFDFFLPMNSLIIAISISILMAILNILGMKLSGKIENILTLIKVMSILTILFFSFQKFDLVHMKHMPSGNPMQLIFYSTLISMYAYTGFEIVTVPEEEIKNARKIIRRSMMTAITLSSVFFILSVIAIIGVKDWQSYGSYNTLFDLYYEINPLVSYVVLIGGIISVITSINALIVGSSRISFSMSRDGMLPSFFDHINSNNAPDYSILFQLVSALLVMLVISDIEFLAIFSISLVISIYFACTIASLKLIKHNIIENRILAFVVFFLSFLMLLYMGFQVVVFLTFSIISGILFYFLEKFRLSSKR